MKARETKGAIRSVRGAFTQASSNSIRVPPPSSSVKR